MAVWRVDRSRVATGHRCEQERYWQYYSGGNGFGVVPVAQSLPLATGSLVHAILGDILCNPYLDPKPLVNNRLKAYRDFSFKTGFVSDDPEEMGPSKEWIVDEQSYLAAGVGLTFHKHILPDILDRFEIIAVEPDIELKVGNLIPEEDESSGTGMTHEGLVLIHDTKPDFIAKRKSDGAIVSWDLKTESSIDKGYADKWRMSVQMGVQCAGAAKFTGNPCSEYHILAIHKGMRSREYNPETQGYDGPKKQNSFFCYGYQFDSGLGAVQFAPKYRYKDEAGKSRNLPKVWVKTPLWQMPLEGVTIADRMEFYLKQVEGKYNPFEVFLEVGPYRVPEVMVKRYFDSLKISELDWALGGKASGSDLVPSFQCWNEWGKRCSYWDLCYEEKAGAGLNFTPRRPHHKGELEEMKEAGVEVPIGWEDEGVTDEKEV